MSVISIIKKELEGVDIEQVKRESHSNNSNNKIDAVSGPQKANTGDTHTAISTPEEVDIGEIETIDYSERYPNSTGDFEITTDNTAYVDNVEDINLLYSVVAAEAANDPDDALAVASVIMNRCDAGNWGGTDPISVITASGQFSGYLDGYYQKYYNGSTPIPDCIKTAVDDALNGVRNNSYQSFRSNGSTGYSNNMVSENGNRYN